MTFYSKVGHFTNTTSGTTDTISGLGFTPVALILWAGQSTTGWGEVSPHAAVGFAANNNGTMQYGTVCVSSVAGLGMSYPSRYHAARPLVMYNSYAYSGLWLNAASVSFISGGFTVTYSSTPSGSATLNYLAIGGSDITAVGVTRWQSNTTTGNQAVTLTGTPFKPSCVLHISDISSSTPPVGEGTAQLMFGAMDNNGNQWCNYNYESGGSVYSDFLGRAQRTNVCILDTGTGTDVVDAATAVTMDTNGFTVNWTVNGGTSYYYYSLAIAGIGCTVGNRAKTAQTAAVTDTVSGLALTPVAVLATTDSYPANTSEQNNFRFTLGASDGTNKGVLVFARDARTMAAYNYNDATNTIIVANATPGTTDVAAPIQNFSSDQFQIVWGADGTTEATQVLYVAFGFPDVNAGSATAVVAPTANVPLVGVAPSGVTGTVAPASNVPLVGVGPPNMTALVAPSANIPVIGVGPPGVTGTVAPVLNVPLVGVGPPAVAAAVAPSAYVPIINVSATPLTAIVGPIANIPLPGVRLVPADAAVISPVANVDEVGVGPPSVTGTVGPTAYVPIIDVSLPDMTIIVHVKAVVPWIGVYVYRHHRAPSQILNTIPRCPGLFVPAGVRCEGLLVGRGSRNVGLLEPDMTRDTYTPEVEN